MNTITKSHDRQKGVRPQFLLVTAAVVGGLIAPDALHHRPAVQLLTILFAALLVGSGWYLLGKCPEASSKLRASIALTASILGTGLIAMLALELAPSLRVQFAGANVVMHVVMYARRWFYWTSLLGALVLAGSLFGRGRPRIAFGLGTGLLLILQLSLGMDIY
jgi:hypothetical protein